MALSSNVTSKSYNDTNGSEVFNSTSLLQEYTIRELQQFVAYRPVACSVGLLILLSNITVVISSGLILKKGQQPKSTYILLGNVSLADTIIGISMLIGFSFKDPITSSTLCFIELGMLVCPAMVSIFSVGLIAVDRYIYILHGLHYQRWVNTSKVRISIIFVWFIGIILGFLPIFGLHNRDDNGNCYYVAVFPGPLVLLNSFLSIVPIAVVAVLYTIILISALKNVRKINASINQVQSANSTSLRVYRGNGNPTIQPVKNTKQFNVRHSIASNSSEEIVRDDQCDQTNKSKSLSDLNIKNTLVDDMNKDNRIQTNPLHKHVSGNSLCSTNVSVTDGSNFTIVTESNEIHETSKRVKRKEATKWRAITIVMLTSGSFICTWMPFFMTVIFYVLCEDKENNRKCLHLRLLLAGPLAALAFLNSALNPLIYAWWHKGFQRYIRTHWKRFAQRYFKKSF
ncbi:unnamed protein product [Leptosia nina]|uniref:G-protein coupled receptors family 1 profile domain-containing protein n=1 Tax=Leptosia nina TaxID=320188 RepID=A0AAV1JMB4_9NEOP